MAQAKKPTTAKSPISSMGLTFESGNPANYPIAYCDNIWDIAQQGTELAEKLGGIGQYDQHTINEMFAGGISKIAETIQSLAQLPANPKKGDTYRIREATTATVREYEDKAFNPDGWRLLTFAEGNYLGNTRPNAATLHSLAMIGNVCGLLLLPDGWDWSAEGLKYSDTDPDRLFTPSAEYYDLVTFTEAEWAIMEQNGAIFLPWCPTYRVVRTNNDNQVGGAPTFALQPYTAYAFMDINPRGTEETDDDTYSNFYRLVWRLLFVDNHYRNAEINRNGATVYFNSVNFHDDWWAFLSSSVRFVRDAQADDLGAFKVGEDKYVIFASGNVQYKPSIKRFRIAPSQFSIAGEEQMNIYLDEEKALNTAKGWNGYTLEDLHSDVWVDTFILGSPNRNPLLDAHGRIKASLDCLVDKQVIYPAGSLIQWNGSAWQWLNGYQNGNLLNNEDFNKVKKLNPIANSGSYNDLTDTPTKVSAFENDAFYAQKVKPVAMNGYKQLAYIESNKDYSQYIDTNIKPNQNTGFEIDFSTPHAPKTANGQPVILNAGGKNSAAARFSISIYATKPGGEFAVNTNKTAIDPKLVANKRLVLKYQNRIFTYTDGTTAEMPDTGDFETLNTLVLFASNNDGGVAQFASVRLYSFKVYDGTTLQAHFAPAQRLSDGVVGLYEAVSGTFFENLGDGTFTGADIDFVINRASQLINDQNLVSDNKYVHTDNNLTNTRKEAIDEYVRTYNGKIDANEAAIELLNKTDGSAGSIKKTVSDAIAEVVANAPASLDTLREIADWITEHADSAAAMNTAIGNKVDKVDNKGLSTNDYTNEEKTKLANIGHYIYVCKNYLSGNSVTIAAATHKCGTAPIVVCYLNGAAVGMNIANNNGEITVSWNGNNVVTPENPLTISIMGAAIVAVEEQRQVYTATFNYLGSSGEPADPEEIEIAVGEAITPPTLNDIFDGDESTPEGYTEWRFTGWSPAIPSTMPANNVEFTAQYEQIFHEHAHSFAHGVCTSCGASDPGYNECEDYGHDWDSTTEFCRRCGEPNPDFDECAAYGHDWDSTTEFCRRCGEPNPDFDECAAYGHDWGDGQFCSRCGEPNPDWTEPTWEDPDLPNPDEPDPWEEPWDEPMDEPVDEP